MHNDANRDCSSKSLLRRSLIGGLLAGCSVLFALPAGNAFACDIAAGPSINFADLPAVLDSGGSVIDPGDFDFEETPQVNGAVRMEVVEVTPENDEYLSGSIERDTNVWGDAAIGPMFAIVPILKADANNCDGGGSPMGFGSYYLSTANEGSIPITGYSGKDDGEVDAVLDELFGPSTEVTDEMAEAATPGGRPDISRPGGVASGSTAALIALIASAAGAAAGVVVIVLWRRRRAESTVNGLPAARP